MGAMSQSTSPWSNAAGCTRNGRSWAGTCGTSFPRNWPSATPGRTKPSCAGASRSSTGWNCIGTSGCRSGWCLTTKLPVRNRDGKIIGVVGVSRDLRAPGDRDIIPARLAATLEYLETHYEDPVSPSLLARHAGLPPVRFARLIKRIFRLTPHQLITQTRLAAASHLLRETDRSLADIALDCGFYDHSAFTRAFRSATNLTPSQYRAIFPRLSG